MLLGLIWVYAFTNSPTEYSNTLTVGRRGAEGEAKLESFVAEPSTP